MFLPNMKTILLEINQVANLPQLSASGTCKLNLMAERIIVLGAQRDLRRKPSSQFRCHRINELFGVQILGSTDAEQTGTLIRKHENSCC